mgnify:CR=1 FL=1
MSLVVPYDSSELSRAALVRAVQFDEVLDQGVIVITAIPTNNVGYARNHGWLGDDEPFDGETIVSRLRTEIADIAPEATFAYQTVSRYAGAGEIGSKLRKMARNHDASIVFIGSENAGRIVRSISVGQTLATDRAYDTMLISQAVPSKIPELEEAAPTDELL